MSLRVLAPGTFSLVVDHGRPASRRLGLPLGGPADRSAMSMGNALLNNESWAPALEITLSGPTLVAEKPTTLGVFGAPFTVMVDHVLQPNGAMFTVDRGQTVQIGGTAFGCRGYVCVRGGFRLTPILHSVTAFAPIAVGDTLQTDACSTKLQTCWYTQERRERAWSADPVVTLRVIHGPQATWFDEVDLTEVYRVLPASNRMGVRFTGRRMSMTKRELVSEAVAPGAIQVSNDGLPIILGVDGQTIGGYPKIAHVIDADLDKIGQLRPGNDVRFVLVTEAHAEHVGAEYRTRQRWLARRLRFARQ